VIRSENAPFLKDGRDRLFGSVRGDIGDLAFESDPRDL
jgi:hypothetical protein